MSGHSKKLPAVNLLLVLLLIPGLFGFISIQPVLADTIFYMDSLSIPSADDWDAGTVAFSQGAEGEWDHILWGGFANSLIKKEDTYYLYYQGSPYYDEQCESVAQRAIGVATSTDGVTWTKYPGNPVITWSSQGSVEEGAVSSAAWLGEDGRIYLYYGANTGTECTIDASARLAVSDDGLTFQDLGEVFSGQDPDVWGSGDEIFPIGVYSRDSQWYLYYTPNGVSLSRLLGVAFGGSATDFTQSMGLNDSTIPAWGPVSVIPAGAQSMLFTNPDGVNGPINIYTFDVNDPAQVSLQDSYTLPNCTQASVMYESDTKHWMMSCRDQTAQNYYIRNAYVLSPITAPLVVTNNNDSGPGSLRQVIADAASGDTITFDPSLAGQTILLSSTLVIDKNMTIDATALASKIRVSGNNTVTVFEIALGTSVIMKNLVIANGRAVMDEDGGTAGGGIRNNGNLNITDCNITANVADILSEGNGGGIHNAGSLSITASTISNNSAYYGGGILNLGTLQVASSTILENSAVEGGGISNANTMDIVNTQFSNNTGRGGGIINIGTMDITGTSFSGNSTEYEGGGILNFAYGESIIRNSTFVNNSAASGSGMYNYSSNPTLLDVIFSNNFGTSGSRGGAMVNDVNSSPTLANVTFVNNTVTYAGGGMLNSGNSNPDMVNVTFSGNSASDSGGGIYNWESHPTLRNVTFSGNSAVTGGAVYNGSNSSPSIVNSILYSDTGGEVYNASGSAVINNSIVQGNYPGTGNLNVDPRLGPLQDNGGFTQTMALAVGSPAIDAGDDTNCPTTDQRGVARPQSSHCDIGAYEAEVTFSDVPFDYWSWKFIERLYNAGVTSGCSTSPSLFCPTTTVTRDQMAVFLLRGKHGASYTPPPATGVFEDVPVDYWSAAWIEQLAAEGITSGCSVTPKLYCPTTPVTRDQMAVFLLRAKHGSAYTPPPASGVFQDVPLNHWAAAWIEQLAAEGITSGCSVTPKLYCPTTPVTRDQMAVFLVKNFNLP